MYHEALDMAKLVPVLLIFVLGASTSYAFADSNSSGFTNAISVNSAGENVTSPQMVVSGGNVYLGWINNAANSSYVLFAKSTDGGLTFGKQTDLGRINSGAPDNLMIVESQGKVYAVWQSFLSNKSSIVFTKSDDEGTTFEQPVQVSDNSKDSAFPQIAVSENHVYFAWIDRTESDVTNIVFDKSDDGGTTFAGPVAITNNNGNSGIPRISANGDNVYLMWEDNSKKNFDIYLSTSSDLGKTFSSSLDISNNTGDSGAPQILVNGTNVYAVWMDNTLGNFDIYFSKSTDGGQTFAKPVDVSTGKLDSGYPQFAVAGNEVYVTWTEAVSPTNYDIFFSKSTDGGQTFGTPLNISNSPGASGWPQVAVDDNIYVNWVDSTPGHFDDYIAKSVDDGKSFEAPVDVDNGSKTNSWYNSMSVSSGTVYLAWQQGDNGGNDIMFAKSTTFVPEFGPVVPLVLVVSIVSIIAVSARSSLRTRL